MLKRDPNVVFKRMNPQLYDPRVSLLFHPLVTCKM